MKVWAQIKDGQVWQLFTSPQLEKNCPGVKEFSIDDPIIARFIKDNNIKLGSD